MQMNQETPVLTDIHNMYGLHMYSFVCKADDGLDFENFPSEVINLAGLWM